MIKSNFINDGNIEVDNLKILQMRTNKLKFFRNHIHQMADPFLIRYNKNIWLFFEEKRVGQKGGIKTLCLTSENKNIQAVDFNLKSGIHMSYPFVFWDEQQLFMIPETGELGEIGLYRCVNFPSSWVKLKSILKGNFVDSSIYKELGIYYLFTTEKVFIDGKYDYKLRLFHSKNVVGDFKEHPCSPLKVGRKYGRSGGAVLKLGDSRFRFSQNCCETYGRELVQFKITKLNVSEYHEELMSENWINLNFNHKFGGHHCSFVADDENSMFIAVDLNHKVSYFQRFVNKIL